MKILITGGLGFIASNFINKYYDKYSIVIIDKCDICSSYKNLTNPDKVKLYIGNINNQLLVEQILENENITHVMHFAAQSHVDNSFNNPIQYTYDNVLGTQNLLEACKRYNKLKLIIHVSTDEVYGEPLSNTRMNENTILCPTNPYSASKAAAEMIVNAYLKSYNLPIIISRGNNVYGPRQYPEKLIPRFINLLKHNKRCTIHGNGSALRSYVYIDDVSSAFETILEKGVIGEIYNIHSPYEYSVLEVSKELIKLIHKSDNYYNYIKFVEDRIYNDYRYHISGDKLLSLGWKPIVSFVDGLKKTIEWYQEHESSQHWNIIPNDL